MGDVTKFTAVANLTGQPAISLPLHWTEDNLPVGVQIIGRYGDEATLLRLASQLESARPWQHRWPPLAY
jgi:amidase